MRQLTAALLGIIAMCLVVLTYDHFYGGTYRWESLTGFPIKEGMSYSECPRELQSSRCVKED